MKSYGIKKIEDKKKKYIDRMFILRQHLSGGALWSILRKLLKRKPKQNKMFVYESRFVDSEIVVSVVVPLYNTPQQYLRAMIESVLEQTYPNWELCLADGSDTDVVCQICQEYVNKDSRVKYLKLEKNRGISENTNEAIRLATGEYIALLDHDDLLVPQALQEVVTVIENTGADFVYTDEGFLQEDENGSSISYHFKPDFALDTLRAVNYICHFSVIRRDLLEQVGMFRSEFDGSQDHDLFLRLAGCAERIEHIPKILYLWRSHTTSVSKNSNTSSYVADAAKRAVLEHLRQQGIVATIQSSPLQTTAFKINYEIIGNPMVFIAIRYNGLVKETARCIDAIVKRSLYENYELAVWNVSCHTREEQEYFGRLKECKSIQVVNDYEDISLKGAKYIVWLDSRVEVADREWIQELLMYSQRDDVGAVGGKILDSRRRVVENGYIVGAGKDGVAMASHEGAGAFSTGYIQRLYFAQNVSALSDKLLMVKAELFQKTGGFDRTLTLHYAAIELCLKLREQGLVNIVNPYAEAYFYRNHQQASEKERMEDSIVRMKKRWNEVFEKGDPYYNPNLSLDASWMMKEDGYGTSCSVDVNI